MWNFSVGLNNIIDEENRIICVVVLGKDGVGKIGEECYVYLIRVGKLKIMIFN